MIGDKELKPETDPDWEARQAERRARAKRKREVFHSDAEHRTAVTDPLLTWG